MSYDQQARILLVEKARKGNHEALSILIYQHRAKMLQWANNIVRNSTKAEDIVQDALIQTFRHIDRLEDPHKFLPWLRSIVRNQSLMTLRKSEEQRVSPVDDELLNSFGSVLHMHDEDPFTYANASQILSEVESSVKRLGKREQDVIRLHVLEGLSISETAERLGMQSAATYTALSRARKKLNDYRFNDEIERYVASRRQSRKQHIGTINVPYYQYASAYDTLVSMLALTANALGKEQWTLVDIFAATGHAFRFHAAEDLGISGPYSYNWTKSALIGLENMNMPAKLHGGTGHQLRILDDLTACMDDIFIALENGIPVIAWGLNNAEFGLITGYNDYRKSWTVIDTSSSNKWLPYNKLGRVHPSMEWFVVIPQKSHTQYCESPIANILTQAVQNIRGTDITDNVSVSATSGTATYQKWIDSFNQLQPNNPLSVAYNLAVVEESRLHATRYLQKLLRHHYQGQPLPESALSAIAHSVQLFENIHKLLKTVTNFFPLPYGADPTSPGVADRVALLLSQAVEKEIEAADALEEAGAIMKKNNF